MTFFQELSVLVAILSAARGQLLRGLTRALSENSLERVTLRPSALFLDDIGVSTAVLPLPSRP
jgi:hypothetical protein